MGLSVIGAGLGRTGTLSLKGALERLGFAPCHHMIEVFTDRPRATAWAATLHQQSPDWDALFEGFRATVDWPSVTYWRELVAHYPEAKVILTLRDPDRWYESALATLFADDDQPVDPSIDVSPFVGTMFDYRFHDREHCIDVFQRHNQSVVDTVPSKRLLQFQVSDGWGPLCAFLGCDVPDEPFPHINESEGFMEMVQARRIKD